MIDEVYSMIYMSALDSSTKNISDEALANEWSLNYKWGEVDQICLSDSEIIERYNISLKLIKLAREVKVSELVRITGLSNRAFALRYGIPRRTMEEWSRCTNIPSSYIKLMIAEVTGYIK